MRASEELIETIQAVARRGQPKSGWDETLGAFRYACRPETPGAFRYACRAETPGAFRHVAEAAKAFVLTAALLLAGCGKSAPTASPLQVLRMGNGSDPQDLDPQAIAGIPELKIVTALFEGLVNEDPKDLHPVPGLAESWDISPDGLTYTFHIRANAKWSNGDPITADDFIQSYQRALTPAFASPLGHLIYDFVAGAREFQQGKTTDFSTVGFRAPNPRTLVIHLLMPAPYLLKVIAQNYMWDPVPIREIAKYGPVNQQRTPWTKPGRLVSSGPFMLQAWEPDRRIVVVRNPNYWDAANVKLDRVEFYPTEDNAGEEVMFRTGQLDLTNTLPNNKLDTYRKDYPDSLHIDPLLGTYFFYVNLAKPPFNDPRVRRALALAIDREAIVKTILRGDQAPALAFSHPDTNGYTPRAQLSGSIAEAQKLLADAGYPGGRGLPAFELLYNTSDNHRAICEAVQEMWKKNLGVEVQLANQEWKVYLDRLQSKSYAIARGGWLSPYLDPNGLLELWVSSNLTNYTNWSNPEYDKLAEASLHATKEPDRMEIFQKMDALIVNELPVIPLYHYTSIHAINPKVKGIYPNLLDHHPYKAIWIEQ